MNPNETQMNPAQNTQNMAQPGPQMSEDDIAAALGFITTLGTHVHGHKFGQPDAQQSSTMGQADQTPQPNDQQTQEQTDLAGLEERVMGEIGSLRLDIQQLTNLGETKEELRKINEAIQNLSITK